jgi:hypothetical protein
VDKSEFSLLPQVFSSLYQAYLTNKNTNNVTSNEIVGGAVYNRKYYPSRFIKHEENKDKTKIGYFISIDMELQKGTSLTPKEISEAKCRQKWNSVRKAYANFTGKKYVIPPVYNNKTQKQKQNENQNENQKQNHNVTRNNKPYPNNETRKQNGGKRNRTIKKH